MAKSPEEQSPCPIISVIAPFTPQSEFVKRLGIIIAICTTEEYAISLLMSCCRRHKILVSAPPMRLILDNIVNIIRLGLEMIGIIRINPYPPNFRRIPARIIEPATGASTWAFGNQR